jgi:alpha-glucosidase
MMEIPWGSGRARLAMLHDDVFRLRICREKFTADNSWAVVGKRPAQKSLPLNDARFYARSPQAILVMDDTSTEWALRDGKGRDILRGPNVGFAQDRGFLRIDLAERDLIFGFGETTGPMNKRGLLRELWNIDVLGHAPAIHPGLKSLYVSIPFAILLRDGRATGIFWDNPARQIWDMGHANPDQLTVECDHGEINLYLFTGPTIQSIVTRYTELTGRMPLPPRWGLGYHQCRYSYESAERILEIAANFRARQIPCDAIYLDIHHMDGYRVFTFGKKFPNPKSMTAQLAENGFRTVAIVDPGVKNDRNFGVLQRGAKNACFIKSPNGRHDYVGEVWPGPSRFPDFMCASVREWWGREQAALHKLGVTGIWNDMNEPANFALPSKTLPPDCRHKTDFGPARHIEIHNAYGSQMASAGREGALKFDPTKRPFIITRAGYAGVQRHALVWTGDNSSTWEHLAESIPQLLNLSLSGIPFCGADIGGFLSHSTGELLARWTQLASLTPFFRNHSNEGTRAQEPWAFGTEIENICRAAIQLRYQFLPYIYSLVERATRDGVPIIRPLIWHYQSDIQSAATQDEFLLGENLLVAPVIQPGARARAVYLPPGLWHEFWSAETHRGRKYILADAPLHHLPLYVKAGAIIPFAPLAQHMGEYSTNELTLQIWPGADGKLEFYDDDGESQSPAEYRRTIEFIDRDRGGLIRFGSVSGKYQNGPKKWRIILHRAHSKSIPYINDRDLPLHRNRALKILAFEIKDRRSQFEIVIA